MEREPFFAPGDIPSIISAVCAILIALMLVIGVMQYVHERTPMHRSPECVLTLQGWECG